MSQGASQTRVALAEMETNAAVLEEYAKDISFVNPVRPAAVVHPKNTEEVQQIVRFANERRTPLVPVSSGPPHFRGDTVPSVGGAVIVDMSAMKKIHFVDRARRVAMCEPGVTFAELIPEVEKAGLKLNMPLLPRPSKSVAGSVLEREPVIMPKYQWDVSDPLACAEVFFGTADEFRTGQAAGPGTVEEQWAVGSVQKAPYGPGTASWHRLIQGAQGTMGIATWVSIRCELMPSVTEPFVVGSSNLNSLLELAYWLVRLRAANECFILNNTNLAAIFAVGGTDNFQQLKSALPAWILFYAVAGYEYFPEERVDSQVKDITEITRRLGVEASRTVGGISANTILKTVQRPSTEPYWKLRQTGACQDIFYLTLCENLDGHIGTMNHLAEQAGYAASNVGVYIQPAVQGTTYHCEFTLPYDPANRRQADGVQHLSATAIKSLMAKGAFFSRPYGENARMILNRDAATVAILSKFKKIFDPHNVMNPGKLCF